MRSIELVIDAAKRNLFTLLGKTPWYPGYNEYKNRFIQDAVKDQVTHDAFLSGERLPENYGIGLDERVVEYPWLFSRLPSTAERILDAGAVLNQGWILDLPQIIQKDVVIYTLAPESFSRISDRVSYVYGDLRRSILRDNAVSAVVCLSTLEHIGMDNTSHYSGRAEYRESASEDYLLVVDELRRMSASGGKVFVSVPFGREQRHDWFQQFTSAMVASIVERFQGTAASIRYYSYTRAGWQISNSTDCERSQYFDFHLEGRKRNSDLAAAARAVACLELTK